jgi:hypothetical protein
MGIIVVLACCGICPGQPQDCPWEWTVGPGAGVLVERDVATAQLGLDLTLGKNLLWGSVGLRGELDPLGAGRALTPYVEAGVWLGVSLGIGGQVQLASRLRAGPHAFLGLPIPVAARGFVEPYYRPALLLGGDDRATVHEVGLLIKWWTARGDYRD